MAGSVSPDAILFATQLKGLPFHDADADKREDLGEMLVDLLMTGNIIAEERSLYFHSLIQAAAAFVGKLSSDGVEFWKDLLTECYDYGLFSLMPESEHEPLLRLAAQLPEDFALATVMMLVKDVDFKPFDASHEAASMAFKYITSEWRCVVLAKKV